MLTDRVAAVRSELLELASALEQTDNADPTCVGLTTGEASEGAVTPTGAFRS